jgi:hypothetical protein
MSGRFQRRSFLLAFAAVATSGLVGCATSAPSEPEVVELLFISPMGEPFRAHTPEPYPVGKWFDQVDVNKDGKVDLTEFLADAEHVFRFLDVNKDGIIDHREIYYYEHTLVPEILSGGGGEGARSLRLTPGPQKDPYLVLAQFAGQPAGAPNGGMVLGDGAPPPDPSSSSQTGPHFVLSGAAPFNLLAEPEPVQAADVRLTGQITLGDFKVRARQRFALLDPTSRGYLTLADLPKTEAQKALMRRGDGGRGRRRS